MAQRFTYIFSPLVQRKQAEREQELREVRADLEEEKDKTLALEARLQQLENSKDASNREVRVVTMVVCS